jgi:hypothetical protein
MKEAAAMFSPPNALPEPPDGDRLGVLATTLPAIATAPQVMVDGAAIAAIAAEWAAGPWPDAEYNTDLHYFDGDERTLGWLALLDALNFCFWGEPGQPRWGVRWGERWINGYDALAAALTRAMMAGFPLDEAAWLAELDASVLAEILWPDPDDEGRSAQIPLFDARLANARELGRVLLERYDGRFAHVIAAAGHDAVNLALCMATDFPSFDDVASWQGQPVRFYKRAQILVADIAAAFHGEGWGQFASFDRLTVFADYKVPQLLRRLGVIRYELELADRIDRQIEIPAGSEDEIAIRAATVWGVECLRRALEARGVTATAAAIDQRMWLASQTAHAQDRPYHRTRTIFY